MSKNDTEHVQLSIISSTSQRFGESVFFQVTPVDYLSWRYDSGRYIGAKLYNQS